MELHNGIALPPRDVFGFFNLLGFPGYRVDLLAGTNVVAMDNNSLDGSIPEGTTFLYQLSFSP